MDTITTPLSKETILSLRAGQMLNISGVIYTARDAAHKRLIEMADRNEDMPIDFVGQIVFYAGPCPSKPGEVIGSIGPTTSGRMDVYSPRLIEMGLVAMIGKGMRSSNVVDAIVKHAGVYFVAIAGAAALMARSVKSVEVVAFEDLGTEAIRRLTVENLPVIVTIDHLGNNALSR